MPHFFYNQFMEKIRCSWCNTNNPDYVAYHDHEWGVYNLDEGYLFEMLILECFQAGLSWECVLSKRAAFREAYCGFDIEKVCAFTDTDKLHLLANPHIIRNRLKINASITNARVFRAIQAKMGSFSAYLLSFTHNQIFYERGKTTSPLSDALSADLKKRGMRFVGSVTIYSYLQAVGIVVSHEKTCFLASS